LFGWQIRDVLPRSAASTRTAPLVVPHPVHVAQQIVVRASRAFRLAGHDVRIADPAFAFSSNLQVAGREMRLSFDYRSLADSVPAARLKAHQQAMERLRDELSFILASDLASPETRQWDEAVTWVVGTIFALWLGGWIALRARMWRRRGFGSRG
jgi:hypothetical protein